MELLHHLKRGKLMFVGKPLFLGMVAVELWWERLLELFFHPKFEHQLVDVSVTAVVKTFERPNELKRLIKSIRQFYPDMHIIVVDDSRKLGKIDGVSTVEMPYDSGVSAGRNMAVSRVDTKYLLLLDDDFVFYRKTDLEPAVKKMDNHADIDIMGGEVLTLPLYTSDSYEKGSLHPTNRNATLPEGSSIGGMAVQDKVANFYIAKTESIKRVGWDARIKRLDHADFFTRAKGVLTTVFNPEFKVLHAQTPFNKAYMHKRNAYEEDQKLLYEKYYR